MAVLTTSWWMLLINDLYLVFLSGPSASYYLMLGLDRPIIDRRRSGRSSVICGRADGRDVVVDGMIWRTAWKSARYAGEVVVPASLDAVRRHLPLRDSQWQFSAPSFLPVGAGSI